MLEKNLIRREFLKYGTLSFLFLLNSCGNTSNKVRIAFQNSFYPDSFKDTIPNVWQIKNVDFGSIEQEKNRNIILDSEFILVNDGWINSIDFEKFGKINEKFLFKKLDNRSRNFLNSFQENQRYKLFPIGVVPYAVIIKNNKDLINLARQSWDFLLSKNLTKKIILSQSPRLISSLAERINSEHSLAKLISQVKIFDDKNALNWLINSDANVAIVPYSICSKYLKFDSRLSVVFPDQGVPLMWHFVLTRSRINTQTLNELNEWINSLETEFTANKLLRQGWYLPFNKDYSQINDKSKKFDFIGPSQKCWKNSWSLPALTEAQKIKFENNWTNSLIP